MQKKLSQQHNFIHPIFYCEIVNYMMKPRAFDIITFDFYWLPRVKTKTVLLTSRPGKYLFIAC